MKMVKKDLYLRLLGYCLEVGRERISFWLRENMVGLPLNHLSLSSPLSKLDFGCWRRGGGDCPRILWAQLKFYVALSVVCLKELSSYLKVHFSGHECLSVFRVRALSLTMR